MFLSVCRVKSFIAIIYNDKRKIEMASKLVFIKHINDWNEITRKKNILKTIKVHQTTVKSK